MSKLKNYPGMAFSDILPASKEVLEKAKKAREVFLSDKRYLDRLASTDVDNKYKKEYLCDFLED